jgi:choline dehydrogenase-like flavoprotein
LTLAPWQFAIPRHAYLKTAIPVAGVAHQAGTVRFGRDSATSALDVNFRAHELDNLYVVDTSFFPSIGAVNPALTAMANAVLVGEHLLQRLGAPTSMRSKSFAGAPASRRPGS